MVVLVAAIISTDAEHLGYRSYDMPLGAVSEPFQSQKSTLKCLLGRFDVCLTDAQR